MTALAIKLWSQKESARAAELWQLYFADFYGEGPGPRGAQRRVFDLIAKDLDRTTDSIANRFVMKGVSFGANIERGSLAPANALAQREARKLAESRHTITGHVLGDPPPGFSALDRKRRGIDA